jgi:hypothetical protein
VDLCDQPEQAVGDWRATMAKNATTDYSNREVYRALDINLPNHANAIVTTDEQEISTLIRHDLKPFIFVINNSGYTVERAVLGKDAKYNDVANWRYSELPNVFSRDKKAETYVVQSSNELQKVLDSTHSGMVFVESVMDKYDAPIDLIVGGHAIADSDYGVRGPQSAANSQIPMPRRADSAS